MTYQSLYIGITIFTVFHNDPPITQKSQEKGGIAVLLTVPFVEM